MIDPEIVFTAVNNSYRMEFYLNPTGLIGSNPLETGGSYNEVLKCPHPVQTLRDEPIIFSADFKSMPKTWRVQLRRYEDAYSIYEPGFLTPGWRTTVFLKESERSTTKKKDFLKVTRTEDLHLHVEVELNMTGLYELAVGDEHVVGMAGSIATCIIQVRNHSLLEFEKSTTDNV